MWTITGPSFVSFTTSLLFTKTSKVCHKFQNSYGGFLQTGLGAFLTNTKLIIYGHPNFMNPSKIGLMSPRRVELNGQVLDNGVKTIFNKLSVVLREALS